MKDLKQFHARKARELKKLNQERGMLFHAVKNSK